MASQHDKKSFLIFGNLETSIFPSGIPGNFNYTAEFDTKGFVNGITLYPACYSVASGGLSMTVKIILIEESDTLGGTYTPVSQDNLNGTYDGTANVKNPGIPIQKQALNSIGVFGTKRFLQVTINIIEGSTVQLVTGVDFIAGGQLFPMNEVPPNATT